MSRVLQWLVIAWIVAAALLSGAHVEAPRWFENACCERAECCCNETLDSCCSESEPVRGPIVRRTCGCGGDHGGLSVHVPERDWAPSARPARLAKKAPARFPDGAPTIAPESHETEPAAPPPRV